MLDLWLIGICMGAIVAVVAAALLLMVESASRTRARHTKTLHDLSGDPSRRVEAPVESEGGEP